MDKGSLKNDCRWTWLRLIGKVEMFEDDNRFFVVVDDSILFSFDIRCWCCCFVKSWSQSTNNSFIWNSSSFYMRGLYGMLTWALCWHAEVYWRKVQTADHGPQTKDPILSSVPDSWNSQLSDNLFVSLESMRWVREGATQRGETACEREHLSRADKNMGVLYVYHWGKVCWKEERKSK